MARRGACGVEECAIAHIPFLRAKGTSVAFRLFREFWLPCVPYDDDINVGNCLRKGKPCLRKRGKVEAFVLSAFAKLHEYFVGRSAVR